MIVRLALFAFALFALPPLALLVAGSEQPGETLYPGDDAAAMLTAIAATAVLGWLLDRLTYRRKKHSLQHSERRYAQWLATCGAILGPLLSWMNLYAPAWLTETAGFVQTLVLNSLLGAVLLPTVLILRNWLGGLPGLVKFGSRRFALPAVQPQSAIPLLLLAGLAGLLGGPVRPDALFWLYWAAPLTLLVALQLMWHENTVFADLKSGNWHRIVLGTLSGLLAGAVTLTAYHLAGGSLIALLPRWSIPFGLMLYGLLCLQIGDIVAESRRGKKRGEVFKKKSFPIPVVVKKD